MSHLTGHLLVPCGLTDSAPPHILAFPSFLAFHWLPSSNTLPSTTASSTASLCQPPQLTKGPKTPSLNPSSVTTLFHPATSETLPRSSVATLPTPQYNPSPQVTPKTSSLCQAKSRSRISRAAVRHHFVETQHLFAGTVVFHLRDGKTIDGRMLLDPLQFRWWG